MRKPAPARSAHYFGMRTDPIKGTLGTWLEPEELTYPSGGMLRRARAINAETGRRVVVRCGIPDTYFSIPCKGGGYVSTSDGGTFIYHPPSEQ